MKLGVLFSGGKDSTYAAYLAVKSGYELSCLISVSSEKLDSWMFHTPNIGLVGRQAEAMGVPIIVQKTHGNKEEELGDLEKAIKQAIKKYKIGGIVTGAVESVYQASRIQSICNRLKIECFNPLWQKIQVELLEELIKNKFKVVIAGVFAYPFDKGWVGQEIDLGFVDEISQLNKKYKINPAGEGGEFESFVLNCPLFKKELKIQSKKIFGEGNSWKMEIALK
ncbi:TIGR00289 family protein [Candidatus Woesearchaeota archaeon CG10_big_fil_rev_8_21_14_0_10_34_12]|nr:MAG: TIGR00289 family protein [Candidatus Woesearchaeota archaeon CG10_big_fil_rev_8_21_14_0_10_34_12]